MFLDPHVRERYDDLETMLSSAVAYLRASVGSDLDDAHLENLVAELSLESDEFRRLWAQHDVCIGLTGDTGYRHPVVGAIRLRYQTLALGGDDDGQTIYVVHAAPGSRDAEALARLATLAAEFDTAIPQPEPPRRIVPDAGSPAIAAAPGVQGANGLRPARCKARTGSGRRAERRAVSRTTFSPAGRWSASGPPLAKLLDADLLTVSWVPMRTHAPCGGAWPPGRRLSASARAARTRPTRC